jgi:hypothetical protein
MRRLLMSRSLLRSPKPLGRQLRIEKMLDVLKNKGISGRLWVVTGFQSLLWIPQAALLVETATRLLQTVLAFRANNHPCICALANRRRWCFKEPLRWIA